MISLRSMIAATALSCLATVAHAQVLGIATNPQGSFYYSAGAALAQVIQQKTNMIARIQPMSGSSGYTPLVNRGEIEFGLLNGVDIVSAYTGTEGFKKNSELRLVGVLLPLRFGIAVPNDSPVKSIKDLKGMRMPSKFTAMTATAISQEALLASGGVSINDMKQLPVSDYVKGMVMLGDGKVDAVQVCLGCATALEVNASLAAHGGLRFLPVADTPEAKAAMLKVFPSAYTQVFQPSPGYPGVIGPTRLMAFSAFLMASTHVSDDVVYKVTKALYQNKQALVTASATLKDFDPDFMAEANVVPYHPGAEKFYKEVGQWPARNR